MTTATDSIPMSARFKQGHADLHEQAEHSAVPAAMSGGTIAREQYIALIRTEYPMHRELDERLKSAREASPALAALVDDVTFMAPHYETDLRHFGIDPSSVETSPAAAQVIEQIRETERLDPLCLLAFHYVRFGASNGNRYVAKKLRPALGIEEADSAPGSAHLDPFGEKQRETWDAFKTRLDAQPLTPEQKDSLVATARLVFTAIMSLHAEVAKA